MGWRKRWRDRLVRPEADAFERFRVEALLLLFGLVLPLSIVWGTTHLLDGAWAAALLYLVVALTVVGALLELRRSRNLPRVIRAALFVALGSTVVATYLTGGLRLTNVAPFLTLIVANVLLLGREGLYWSLVTLACALLFQLGHGLGYVYPDTVPPANRPLDAFLTWLSSAVLLMLWVAAYERVRAATMKALAEREKRILRDIADRRRAEQEREELQAQLLQAQKMESIGRLAGGVAHDFNNLLTTIIGYCEMLRRHETLSEQGSQDLSEVGRAARRAASLTQQLLAFSRKQLIAPRVVDLGQVIERSARMLRRVLGEQVKLTMRRAEAPCWANVDPHQLDQLLLNLALNARDAMPEGGELTIDVGAVETKGGPMASLRVQDTGTGMDAETARQVFDPFFTTKEVGKGSGLGLATVYGVVKQNGGRVEIETAPGEGTTFLVFLPLSPPPVDGEQPLPPTPQTAPSPLGRERILLVEDEQDVRALAERVLSSAGYLVTSAAEGDAATREAQASDAPFDLLVTDVVMPGGDGASLYKRLHGLQPALRVLFCSGYAQSVLSELGAELGDELLLSKPYSPTELLLRVRKRLDEPPRDGSSGE